MPALRVDAGRRTPDVRCLRNATATGLVLLALVGCSPSDGAPAGGAVIDLLQQDWRSTPGVVADGHGMRVASTGRSIVEQDGSGGRANPPVNLAGAHLTAPGDFSLSASFEDVTDDATLAVYDSPPIIADEFRIEPASLRLTLRGDLLRVRVFDGDRDQDVDDPQPVFDEQVTVVDRDAEISVLRSGGRLEIASDGEQAFSVPFGDVFESGELWLGLSSDEGTFTVGSLTATAPAGAALAVAGPAAPDASRSPDGLQALAAGSRPGFAIGAAAALGPLVSDADYASNLIGEFGAITPENAMKPQSLSPRQGEYSFEEADALLDIAEREGMAVHGHTIAFSEAMPRWMQELPTGSDQERQASAEALLDYVTTVTAHFRGRLDSLDVVNEPFDVDQGTRLQENVWHRVFGPEYPVIVSQAVDDADPDVQQFINENGADVPGPRQEALLELALDTNAAGGHIDGVGLQAHVYHLDTDAIAADDLATTFESFEEAGLLVRISENDVTDSDGPAAQAQQFATVLAACIDSPTCVSYTTWGVDDRYDWWTDDEGRLHQGHDLLFDGGDTAPAYDALRRALQD